MDKENLIESHLESVVEKKVEQIYQKLLENLAAYGPRRKPKLCIYFAKYVHLSTCLPYDIRINNCYDGLDDMQLRFRLCERLEKNGYGVKMRDAIESKLRASSAEYTGLILELNWQKNNKCIVS